MIAPDKAPPTATAEKAELLRALGKTATPLLLVAIGLYLYAALWGVGVVLSLSQAIELALLAGQFLTALLVLVGKYLCWERWHGPGRLAAMISTLAGLLTVMCLVVAGSQLFLVALRVAVDPLVLFACFGGVALTALVSEIAYLVFLNRLASAAPSEDGRGAVGCVIWAVVLACALAGLLICAGLGSPGDSKKVEMANQIVFSVFVMQAALAVLAWVYANAVLRVRYAVLHGEAPTETTPR
jgi:hypothetical protein